MRVFKVLKQSRVALALIFLLLTLALFIDIYEVIAEETFSKILYLQFVPSLLSFIKSASLVTASGFIIIILLTLLMGRFYCSTICPLGVIQDAFSYIAKKRTKKRVFFKYKKPQPIWRYSFLIIMIVAIAGGFGFIVAWLDPYSIAGRFFSYLVEPVAMAINNAMAGLLQNRGNYAMHHVKFYHAAWLPLSLTLAMLLFIGIASYKRGRFFCNVICPVGTFLGLTSKAAILKVKFNPGKCTKCGYCASVCKSECISIKNQSIDTSRCVTCFNCLTVCEDAALDFGPIKSKAVKKSIKPEGLVVSAHKTDKERRKLLVTGMALMAGSSIYALKKNKLAPSQAGLTRNERDYYPVPPGAISVSRFNTSCTACSLCVSACPTHVLQPSITEYGLSGFLQPFMDYETNYCNFDCHKCAEVCPTGAILPLAIDEKQQTQLGVAVFLHNNCIVVTEGTDCGACSEHCPTKAVHMIPYKNGLMIPEVDQSICIGCGACEYPCPVPSPYRAIYVNGNSTHKLAEKPKVEEQSSVSFDDFPF